MWDLGKCFTRRRGRLNFQIGISQMETTGRRRARDMERRATLLPTPVATEPPYSVSNELRYFVSQGVPLLVMSSLKMGVPPFFSMVVAGQTPESETLQASLGYARTFYNCVTMMPTMALCNYFQTVVPGAIGANRHDRLPRYFWRSVLLTSLCILPSIVTQWFAEPILIALGVPRINAQGVGVPV